MSQATFPSQVKTLIVLGIATLFSAVAIGQKTNAATGINWIPASGSGAPTLSCTSLNYGQPYTDTVNNAFYACGSGGWFKGSSGSLGSVTGVVYAASGSPSAATSAQIQTAIGAGVYDASGAAASKLPLAGGTLTGPLSGTTITAANINGYFTVDGTTYTTLNQAWTAAAAYCVANPTSAGATVWLGPTTYNITAALQEPDTQYCGVSLRGSSPGLENGSGAGTTILATAAISTAMLYQDGVNSTGAFKIEGVAFIGGGYYGYPVSSYQIYATNCIYLGNGQYVIRDVSVRNCGTLAGGGVNAYLGAIGGGGSIVENLTGNYDEGAYGGPQGVGSFYPPNYNIRLGPGFTDSTISYGGARNATIAAYEIDSGASNVKTYYLHGFGSGNQYSGVFSYQIPYAIEDWGSNNTHTSPVLDSFSKAGIYMHGAYNSVTAPTYEIVYGTTGVTNLPAYLVQFGVNAKNETFLGGTCQGYGTHLTSEFLYDSGAGSNAPLQTSTYTSAPGCGLYTYQYQNGGGNAAGINYTQYSCSGGICAGGVTVRETGAAIGTPMQGSTLMGVSSDTNNPLSSLDDAGQVNAAALKTGVVTNRAVGAIPAPTVTVVGTTGSTTYSYMCTSLVGDYGVAVGTVATITNGNATLSSTNYNKVQCPSTGAVYIYNAYHVGRFGLYRTAGGATQGQLATNLEGQATISDTGLTATGSVPTGDSTGYVLGGYFRYDVTKTYTQPTCSSSYRSAHWLVQGNGTTTSDVYQTCMLLSTGAYVWQTSIPAVPSTATATPGTNVTSVTCASATCTNTRGTFSAVVGVTPVTSTLFTLTWPATATAYVCTATMNGGTAFFGVGNSVATTTGMTVSVGVSTASTTVTVNYSCQP
jgi:hypothetical protein